MVTAKANKLLGLLRRTCPMLTDVKIRTSLYLALVKSQMSYETEVWSRAPSHSTLKQKAERVQRIATRWILQIKPEQGELSYKERLIHLDLDLLLLTYDREAKDLVFFIRPYILVLLRVLVACENTRFSLLFAAGDVSRGRTSFLRAKRPQRRRARRNGCFRRLEC